MQAAPPVQGAACSIPRGWGTSQTRQADTQLTPALFPLTFPCSLSSLRSPAISHRGFHVAQTEGGGAFKAAPTTEAALHHTHDLQPGMVGDNSATSLQQSVQIPQPGHAAPSLHLPTTLHSTSKARLRLKTSVLPVARGHRHGAARPQSYLGFFSSSQTPSSTD